MVSAMDWNPYSKASVCWDEGDRQSHVLEPQNHPPAPALALARDPAAETMDAERGETVAQAEPIGTPGLRMGDMPTPDSHQDITRQYCSHQSQIAMAS